MDENPYKAPQTEGAKRPTGRIIDIRRIIDRAVELLGVWIVTLIVLYWRDVGEIGVGFTFAAVTTIVVAFWIDRRLGWTAVVEALILLGAWILAPGNN